MLVFGADSPLGSPQSCCCIYNVTLCQWSIRGQTPDSVHMVPSRRMCWACHALWEETAV